MPDSEAWSWDEEKRAVCNVREATSAYAEVHEPVVSPDGEQVAAPFLRGPDDFGVWVSDGPWEGSFEKAWHLQFTPDGRLTALVRVDDEWTVAVDGELWEERWEFAWNTRFSADGRVIAVQIKDNMEYTVAVDGLAWEARFPSSRGLAVSADGATVAAPVQVVPLGEGDIFGFLEGTWSVAVNGEPWDRRFLNVYGPTIDPVSSRVAAEVRLDICEYTLAEDAEPWGPRFGCVWEPVFRPGGGVVAPVRQKGSWTLAEGGTPIWDGRYLQLWNHRMTADGRRIAAVAATSFGRWTVVVDDVPWPCTFGSMVRPPVLSADGRRIAAAVRDNGSWGVAVDGEVWSETFDMVSDPVFTDGGEHVLAKVERGGRFAIAVDGRVQSPFFDALWDPVASPDGRRVLVRAVEDGVYVRQVAALDGAVSG